MTAELSSITQALDEPEFATSILAGLTAPQKYIESKWLYDARGSQLFEAITDLEEYYPTRTELGILRDNAGRLADFVQNDSALIELGSGSSTKTRILLDSLTEMHSYVPIDISQEHLHETALGLAVEYPDLRVHPVVADFTNNITLPPSLAEVPKILFFPGSTIGNFKTSEAGHLLERMRHIPRVSAFVVGMDLVKDTQTLIHAYDDKEGLTAAFNLNLLTRINSGLGANFDVGSFRHEARWNADKSRIEMHLVSDVAQTVNVLGQAIYFAKGETIHSESSHKYTVEQATLLADQSGWNTDQMWIDDGQNFCVAVLTPDES